jgi:hypothetical protein
MICTDASYNSYWRSEGGGVHLVCWLYLSDLFILYKFGSCNVAENWLKVTINTNTSYVIDLSVFLVKEIVVMSFKFYILPILTLWAYITQWTNFLYHWLHRMDVNIVPIVGYYCCFWQKSKSIKTLKFIGFLCSDINKFHFKSAVIQLGTGLRTSAHLFLKLSWKKPEYPERTTNHGQATGKLYHLQLRVECTLFCNLQRRAWTHAILVIGLLSC